ncbi:MAG: DUF2142 domain-containing protein [Actinomycetota bacterium]
MIDEDSEEQTAEADRLESDDELRTTGRSSVRQRAVSVLKKVSTGFWKTLHRPEYMVVIVGLVFGVLLLVTTPPSLVCDEPMHLYNSYRLSQGRLLPPEIKGIAGNYVPASFPGTFKVTGSRDLIAQTGGKQDVDLTLEAFKIPLRAGDTVFIRSYQQYPPGCYVPQAIAMAVGRLFGAPPILLMYLARLFTLLAVLFLAFMAVRVAPIMKWTFFLLFLMPSTLFLISSSSADALTIAFSFLAVAYFLKLALQPDQEVGRRELVFLGLIALALSLVKAPYFLVFLGFLIIPPKRFGGLKRYVLTFGMMLLGMILIVGLWQFLAGRHITTMIAPGVSPFGQLRHIIGHPWSYVRTVASDLLRRDLYIGYYENSLNVIAGMSWGTTTFPTWVPWLFLFSAISVTALDKDELKVTAWQKACSFAVFLAVEAAVITSLYTTISTVGSTMVPIHGRYFIPALPLLFVPFYNRSIIYRKSRFFYLVVSGLGALFAFSAFYMILARYY